MSRTLTIPDDLYERLEAKARERGLDDVEGLLQEVGQSGANLGQRREAVGRIDGLRERLFARYGELPDSVELLVEDRAR
jgi:hypothetical protein